MNTIGATLADNRFVLVFYGGDPDSDGVQRFFRLAVAWFRDLGFPPERLGVTGTGYGKTMGTFRRGLKKIEVLGFSTVEQFQIDALMPNDLCGSEHFVSASFSRGARRGRYAILSVPSRCVTRDVWLPIAREEIECLCPAYGIAFERPLSTGPTFYAVGVNVSRPDDKVAVGEEYEVRRSISRWCDTGMFDEVYRKGLLRYLYRWNFLTQLQLAREVEGVSLREWIAADRRRGALAHFCNDVWLWEIHEDQLERLRDRLHEAGAIFDWRKYCNVETHIKTRLG